MKILAGDIGGTKTLLQLCDVNEATRVFATRSYSSRAYEGLESIVREFLDETAKEMPRPAAACFAVAGPVRDQKTKITNLPWMLDAEHLAARLGIEPVRLINDMHGVGYGIEGLDAGELEALQAGEPDADGTRAILAAGTGLGQGAMVRCGDHTVVLAGEGGHVDYAPRNETQIELLRYLFRRAPQVSCEMLLCGSGLVRIYGFLRETGRAAEPAWLGEALRQADDPAAVISTTALAADAPCIARLALEQFVGIFGAQAGNFALTVFATGGVYLAGGIVPKIADAMRSGLFIEAFKRNVAMGPLLERVPVYVVKTPDVGLLGARRIAARLVGKTGHDSMQA